MRDDDPRHGTNAGYIAGCRCEPCTTATRKYHKHLVVDHARGVRRLVDATGVRRRIQALMALGWSGSQIGSALGTTAENVRQIRSRRQTSRETRDRVGEVYERMCMTLPPETCHRERQTASRMRNHARRLGWAPPLAWDDIDDPAAVPAGSAPRGGGADPVVVARILGGEWRMPASPADRLAVIEQWLGSLNDLERLTGWNVHRERRAA